MLTLLRILLSTAFSSLQTPRDLAVENLALRQQIAILMRTSPRPRLTAVERSFWVAMSRLWPGWKDVPVIVKPETVVRWHRVGFRLFWRVKSTLTARPGRPGFSDRVVGAARNMGIESKRTSYRSPWQNGIAERWIGSCRRELLDHVVPFGEAHLRRLLLQYVRYYHDDRTHLGLGKNTPGGRLATSPPSRSATVVALPRIGGVHHRYEWRDAA